MRSSTFSFLAQILLLSRAVSCNPVAVPLEFVNEYGALEAIPPDETGALARRQDAACSNTANTRACWSSGFSIATDFDAKFPETGVDRTYNLEITNTTALSPDGFNRMVMAINGQYRKSITWIMAHQCADRYSWTYSFCKLGRSNHRQLEELIATQWNFYALAWPSTVEHWPV